MPLSIEDARARLATISEALSMTLNQALERYKPNKYMEEELKGYLPVWGERPLHEFVEGVVSCGNGDEPDVWNADMEPINILLLLDVLYRS